MNRIGKIITGIPLWLLILGVKIASATTDTIPPGPHDLAGVKTLLCNILNWLYTFALIVGVVFIIIAAFNYITSNGNSEKVGKANKALMYAIVGIVVAVLANSAPSVIGNILGAGSAVSNCGS